LSTGNIWERIFVFALIRVQACFLRRTFGVDLGFTCRFLFLVHRRRWWQRKGAATRGGGYFFPLRRKKVTKKGATSLEEAIFFYAGQDCTAM
jgi:hypothetical protein